MSQDFIDPEICAEFIIEAREHLETIEPNLLELEKNPESVALLNDIFRPMHSLKGASGFLGLNRINHLAHKAENVLDELRKGTMLVNADIMDAILAATDLLRLMIDNLDKSGGEGEVEVSGVVERFEAILRCEGPSTAPCQVDPAAEAAKAEGELPRVENVLFDFSPPEEAEAGLAPLGQTHRATTEVTGEVTGEGAGKAGTGSSEAESFESARARLTDLGAPGEPYKLQAVGAEHLGDFMEEAWEITLTMNAALVELEKDPGNAEVINDIFRYFHNLKGNSGIIGHRELSEVTHEAETLLGLARKGEKAVDRPLVDLLLASVDVIEKLLGGVDQPSVSALPFNVAPLVQALRAAAEPGPETEASSDEDASAPETSGGDGPDDEDVAVFRQTVGQQMTHVDLAFTELAADGSRAEYVDALYRSLNSIQNSCAYMGFEAAREQAGRTAGLVDQARKQGLDFGLMLDILKMETSILKEMIDKLLPGGLVGAPAPKSVPEQTPKAAPAPAAPPVLQPAPVASPAPPKPAAPKPAPVAQAAPTPQAPQAPQTESAAGAQSQKQKGSSTIRVDHEKLDHLMNLIGELIINRNRYAMIARSMEDGTIDAQNVALQLTETTYAMARISDDLQDTIMKVRMVPVATVFTRFPRLVRDLSRKSGKNVELITEGEETELDKSVVEVIGDPLTHLIRNSMDHGLEPEDERVAAGKSPVGKVWLRAFHKGNSVVIEIEDDGRGIDPEKMRAVAVKKGVITAEEARTLDDRAAIDLIFAPGFSSAEQITDISGRGVGMDVVRTNIKDLKGNVNVTTELGKGTKFSLSLPLTLAIIDALMVKVAGATYAIPLDAVSETTKIETGRLTEINGRKAVTLRGEVLGIVELTELLNLPRSEKSDMAQLVVIHDNDRRLGLAVDRLLERQEVVIKPLGAYLSNFELRGVSGATIMGDGSVVLILDPHEMYKMATTRT